MESGIRGRGSVEVVEEEDMHNPQFEWFASSSGHLFPFAVVVVACATISAGC